MGAFVHGRFVLRLPPDGPGAVVALLPDQMTWKLNFKARLAGALTFLAGTAHAQTAPTVEAPAQQYLAHISIQAVPFTELVVVPQGAPPGSAAVARCMEYCDFWASPGKYTVYSRNHTTGVRKELSLRVKQSSRFVLHIGDDEDRQAGLVLGVSGSTRTRRRPGDGRFGGALGVPRHGSRRPGPARVGGDRYPHRLVDVLQQSHALEADRGRVKSAARTAP